MRPSAEPQGMWMYAFGGFRLDPIRGVLTYGSEIVPLPDRLFALLLALIGANGSVVSRETLARAMSPESSVSEANLSQHIYLLRRLLGERARDRLYITTSHARGFRFVAPVSVVRPPDSEVVAESSQPPPEPTALDCGLAAFRHYARGAYLLDRRTATTLRAAIKSFEDALAISPNYAPAWVGLGRAYAMLAEYLYVPASYAYPKAKEAVIRALKLDPASASAHAALSDLFLFCDWDWREAKREIDIAVRINPDCIAVCTTAVWYYGCVGSADRGRAQVRHALQIEPASPALHVLLGRALARCGEVSEAIGYFSDIMESGPDAVLAQRLRAQLLVLNGRPQEAIVDLLSLDRDPSEDVATRLPLLARAYADSGELERASEIYSMLLEWAKTQYVTQWNLALVATGLGRYDRALEHLENAVTQKEPSMVLRTSPWFAPLVKTDRYKSLMRTIGP